MSSRSCARSTAYCSTSKLAKSSNRGPTSRSRNPPGKLQPARFWVSTKKSQENKRKKFNTTKRCRLVVHASAGQSKPKQVAQKKSPTRALSVVFQEKSTPDDAASFEIELDRFQMKLQPDSCA